MWLEPPAKPSQNTEQALVELANYYRQLVVYHQQSAAIAASQLAQIETLLNPSLTSSPTWQSIPFNSVVNPPELVAELATERKSLPERQLPTPEEFVKSIQSILAVNRGKILRLDYLVLEIAENYGFPPSQYPALKQQLKQTLDKGEHQGLWASIPDSVDCWTLDLQDFPDLVPQSLSKSRSTKKSKTKRSSRAAYNRSRLPNLGRMKEYETLTAAISQCLREYAPQTVDAHQVMDWIYPDGLSDKVRNKAYQAISDGLNKGCSRKHWERAEIGWYYLDE
ncbi:MAG: hypothetical protein ACFCU5_06205 [Pleurocapsa sp.]